MKIWCVDYAGLVLTLIPVFSLPKKRQKILISPGVLMAPIIRCIRSKTSGVGAAVTLMK